MRFPNVFFASLLLASCVGVSASAQDYAFDPAHTSVSFQASHLGISWTHGRFNSVDGEFSIAPDPSQSKFKLTISVESLDTGNTQRDEHLRSPDFFNAVQFPTITFQSTSVVTTQDAIEVTGNLTLHGVTKSVTIPLKGGKTAEFPAGVKRIGYTGSLGIKRSEFEMSGMPQAVGDDVYIAISFEGIQK